MNRGKGKSLVGGVGGAMILQIKKHEKKKDGVKEKGQIVDNSGHKPPYTKSRGL